MITHARLLELFRYNKHLGVFVRRITVSSRARKGQIAGCKMRIGDGREYVVISVDSRQYSEHRLAWFYTYGVWPGDELDHKDGNGLNNSIDNLREADSVQNQGNTRARRNNKLGIKGVRLIGSAYRAEIKPNGKTIHLGNFKTPEEANEAYMKAAKVYYGEFARG